MYNKDKTVEKPKNIKRPPAYDNYYEALVENYTKSIQTGGITESDLATTILRKHGMLPEQNNGESKIR